MKSLKYKAVLLDLDGTLIDSLGDIAGHMNRVREHFGLAPRRAEELLPFIGYGVEELAGKAIPEVGPERVEEIILRFRDSYAHSPHVDGALYPGVRETLDTLRELGVLLALATNKGSRVAEKCLDHYLPGIPFAHVAGADRVSRRKPHPAHLTEVLEKLGVDPAHACYVGDHPVDREVARAAQVDFFAAGYGFGGVREEPERNLSKFPELLDKILVSE